MNIILTGATGFLGGHLAHAFLQDGHNVIALKRQTSNLRRLADIRQHITFYDLEDLDLSRPFIEQAPIDAVIHTATCYGRADEPATQVFAANTEFPLRLLETAIYFNTDTFLNTDTFFNTDRIVYPYLNAYSLSKKQFAEWGYQLVNNRDVRFINIRLEHIYGPGDDPSKFTTWIVKKCLQNEPEIELTAGQQRRDFIYVDDAVSAYKQILRSASILGPGGQEIGLGSGHACTVREFVEMAHHLSGSRSHLSFGALPYREHELMESQADIRRLRSLGWMCEVSLQNGLSAMLEELKG